MPRLRERLARFARGAIGTGGIGKQLLSMQATVAALAEQSNALAAGFDDQMAKQQAALGDLTRQSAALVAGLSDQMASVQAALGDLTQQSALLLDSVHSNAAAIASTAAAQTDAERRFHERLATMEAGMARLLDSIQQFRAVYLGGGRVLVRFRHLPLVFVADAADRIIIPHMIQEGEYESEVTAWLLANLPAHSVCFDIGANIGYHACIMAKLAWQGRVFAFEPDPETFVLLTENRDINWLEAVLEPRAVAISEAPGDLTFHRVPNRSANTSVAPAVSGVPGSDSRSFSARSISVDSFCDAEGVAPDLLKIDVEGAELMVLRGARSTIARLPHLRMLMEWSPGQLELAGFSARELLDEIESQNLRVHRLNRDGTESESASRDVMLNTGYWNVVLRNADPDSRGR